jgi:hypothetical protein
MEGRTHMAKGQIARLAQERKITERQLLIEVFSSSNVKSVDDAAAVLDTYPTSVWQSLRRNKLKPERDVVIRLVDIEPQS